MVIAIIISNIRLIRSAELEKHIGIRTPIAINLSHIASKLAPNLDTKLYFLAIFPSIESVKNAIEISIVAPFKLPLKYNILNGIKDIALILVSRLGICL